MGVINNILDISKIEANKFDLFYADFNLDMMLDKIINVVNYQMEEKNQCFALSIDPDVPKNIRCDEQKLRQVIMNLLSNAIKFTPNKGSISLLVHKLQYRGGLLPGKENGIFRLQFEVKDTGIGISEEKQADLFNPFIQADSSISRKYGGTGLGLAISKRIIELMDGNIKVESIPGQGTSFIFDIQAETAVLDQFGGALSGKDGAAEKYPNDCFKHLTLIVADDIEINREIVASLLEFTGVTIDFAENGKLAFDLFSANPSTYNMIFMDIHMPEVNGYEATKTIRLLDNPHAKTIPIIAITADVFQEDIEKCLAAGMDDHIGKPLNVDCILDTIAKYCA